MQRSPSGDMPLQGAHLRRPIATGMPLTQQRKQRGALQGRIAFELRNDPGPIFLKGIAAGMPSHGDV